MLLLAANGMVRSPTVSARLYGKDDSLPRKDILKKVRACLKKGKFTQVAHSRQRQQSEKRRWGERHGTTHCYRIFRRFDCDSGEPGYIVASVTDVNGSPVPGLGVNNFKVDPMIIGAGGALVNIVNVSAGRLAGFYHINVLPIRAETWKAGVYIFAIAVEKGADRGQTLATVLMD